MRAVSTFFVALFLIAVINSGFGHRRTYRRPIPPAPVASAADDFAKPKLRKGPDGKIHILDPDGTIDRVPSYTRSRQPAPIGSEVSFEPGKPMVDVTTSSTGSRYR